MDTNEKGLLLLFCQNNLVVNIIKLISDSKYEIIYSIELPYFRSCIYSFNLAELCEGNL